MLDPVCLQAFVAVADTLHFGRAAGLLRIAQPAVSQRVRRLETDLEARLFTRDRHGVALTAVGAVLLREARHILAQLEHAREEVERIKAGGAGAARLGYLAGATRGFVTPALRALRGSRPELRVELRELAGPRVLDTIRAGEIDVAVLPETSPPHPAGLERAPVGEQPLRLALASDDPLARRRAVPLAALRHARWVVYSERISPGHRRWLGQLCSEAGFVPTIGDRVSSPGALLVAVAAGRNVALVAEGYRALLPQGVVLRSITPNPAPMAIWVWWRRGERDPGPLTCVAALRRVG